MDLIKDLTPSQLYALTDNIIQEALADKLGLSRCEATELASKIYGGSGEKELDAIKYAVVKEDGVMAWTATSSATYKTEKGVDDKLSQLKRLKYPGYRKVRVYYKEMT